MPKMPKRKYPRSPLSPRVKRLAGSPAGESSEKATKKAAPKKAAKRKKAAKDE